MQIVAQGVDVMVEMSTSPSGSFHQGFRLSVTHQRRRKSQAQSIISPCHRLIDASTGANRQGSILSPRHWFPKNIDCTWTLKSKRILLEIQSKSGQNHHQDSCFHQLELPDDSILCESNRTIPSILIRDQVRLHFFSLRGSLSGSELDFRINYILLPAQDPFLPGSICDRIVEDSKSDFDLMGDRLLLRDNPYLKCHYQFQAPENYRIRIIIKRLSFDPIRQCEFKTDDCIDKPFDSLIVSDRNLRSYCFCQSSANQTILESTSNLLDVWLDLKQIIEQAYKDPDIYRFHIEHTWIEDRCGRPIDHGQGGAIRWISTNPDDQACSWLVELPPNDRILLKMTSNHQDCGSTKLILSYHDNGTRHQVETLCNLNGEVISPFPLRFIHVQLVEIRSSNIRFVLKWNVLFDGPILGPSFFLCPESNWSIPMDLVCDGRINCPQNDLYGYLLDEGFCLAQNNHHIYYPWFLVLICSFGFGLLIVIAGFFSRHVRKWRHVLSNKAAVPPPSSTSSSPPSK